MTLSTVIGFLAAVCTTAANFPQLRKAWVSRQKRLLKAIKGLDLPALTEDPLSIVGTSHECDAPLDLMSWKD